MKMAYKNGAKRSFAFFLRSVGPLVAISAIPVPTFAVESASFSVSVNNLILVDSVTSAELGGARAHLNFPFLKQHSNGDLVATYSVGQTQSGMQSGRQAISSDGGLTWSARPFSNGDAAGAHLIVPPGQTSQAFGVFFENPVGFNTWNNNGRYRSFNGGTTWDNGTDIVTYNTGSVQYTVMNHSYDDVLHSGSTLYMAQFGKRLGSSTFESVLMVSTNGGKTWNRRSTIAQHTSSQNLGMMGGEGPTETGLLRLDDGNLLAVYRTGQPFPNTDINAISPALFWSISTDDGMNWSAPKTLGVAGVFPQLRKLPDGSVALTTGRYGARLMLADPSGLRWSEPVVIHNGPSSGHTELRTNADGSHVYLYDQSGFYPPPWNGSVPSGFIYDNDQSANLWAAHLDIQVNPTIEDLVWSLDYHGDVTPDTLNPAWSSTQTGTSSVRLWAELGQDFIRTDTGIVSGNNSQFYSLQAAAANSSWAGVDFSQGLVLETRARVGSSSSAEGAASIFLSDGTHGSLTFELDNNSINLDGFGGQSGQVEYSTAVNPGFSPLEWHNYRLIIRPDATQGGAITALLYLDDDLVNPILTQQMQASALDEIRFGDLAGTANGIFDMDFLRFAPLPNEAIWVANVSGNWNQQNLWLAGSAPNGTDKTVVFGGAISQAQTVYSDVDVTAKQIRFNNDHSYAVAGLGQINLEAAFGDALLEVDLGNHQFQAIVQIHSNTTIDIADNASLAMNNEFHLNGNTVTKIGLGSLAINNLLVTDGGIIDVQAGTVTGSGLLVGSLANLAGIVSPGNSPGRMEITEDYIQGSSAVLKMEIAGLESGLEYDVLRVGGTAFLDGVLDVSFLAEYEASLGNSFQIIDAGAILGQFDSFLLPELPKGLRWDLQSFLSNGSISIGAAVPEPSTSFLLVLATVHIVSRRIRFKSVGVRPFSNQLRVT